MFYYKITFIICTSEIAAEFFVTFMSWNMNQSLFSAHIAYYTLFTELYSK